MSGVHNQIQAQRPSRQWKAAIRQPTGAQRLNLNQQEAMTDTKYEGIPQIGTRKKKISVMIG